MKPFTVREQYVLLVILLCLCVRFIFPYAASFFFSYVTGYQPIEEEKPLPFAIEIVGAIAKPGIYCFEHPVNLGELIERAGGLNGHPMLPQAFVSRELSNGAKITVGGTFSPCLIERMEPEKRLLYFIAINVNAADLDDLLVVPHIGEKTARSILSYRQANGPFSSINELKKVYGIGPSKLEKMKDYLTL